jgi:DNA-directed RNA polymerase specialized sigma24 family protein
MPTNTEISNCIDEWCHNIRHREALKGRMIDGLTNGEIADRMHVDERTVKRYVQRGRAAIEGHI